VISRHQNRVLSYRRLDEDSDALARGLMKLGVSKGDRCAVSLGNNIEYATVSFLCFLYLDFNISS
jgi:TBC1 domain family member 8/9